jgi:hypothetical protein
VEHWLRLWSTARIDLGLATEEFYALTGRQLDALMRRHLRQVEDGEFMLAQLTAYVVNFSMCRPKEPVAIKDFMPSQWAKQQQAGSNKPQKRKKPKRRSRAVIAHELHGVMAHFIRNQ